MFRRLCALLCASAAVLLGVAGVGHGALVTYTVEYDPDTDTTIIYNDPSSLSSLLAFQTRGPDRLTDRWVKLIKTPALATFSRKRARAILKDIQFSEAMAKAGFTYLIMLLTNGLFAHTLYDICWWMVAGLAICLLNITTLLEKQVGVAVSQYAANREEPIG